MAPEPKTEHREIAPAAARRYLLAVGAGVLGGCALFMAALGALSRSGHLPPPAFANSLCTDEKLNFLRARPIESPNLLVIGSSVAWRHIDGEVLVKALPGAKPLNAGFCGLRANQSVFVANWMLDRHTGVRHVLMIVSRHDLTRCKATPKEVFSRQDADSFVYGKAAKWPYYFKYFDPVALARAAFTIKDRRGGKADFDDLVFSAYADGPLKTARSRELGSDETEPLDPACLDSLRSLVDRLERDNISFSMVTTPVHPEWIAQGAEKADLLEEVDEQLLSLASTEGFSYWNAATQWAAAPTSFTDAIHLRWPAAQQFTAAVAQRLAVLRSPSHGQEQQGLQARPAEVLGVVNSPAPLQNSKLHP